MDPSLLKITELITSIGRPAPTWGELNATAYQKISDALSTLVTIVKSAKALNLALQAMPASKAMPNDLIKTLDAQLSSLSLTA